MATTLAVTLAGAARAAPDEGTSATGISAEVREQAKAEYRKGAEAFSDGRYKDAIDFFLAANKIAPLPAFSYNIGLSYEEMGDDARALR